uniref:Transmembrane protein 242 n=4 Tax=Panicoideae TaxID=147369 RepID=K4A2S7_SETIT
MRLSVTVALPLAGDSRRRSVPSPVRPFRSHRRLLRSIGVALILFPTLCWCWACAARGSVHADLDRHSASAGFVAMGLFRGSFTLLVGMGCGVYIAQNYNVPNVKKLFNTYVFLAKHIEETYRKPKKDDD